MRGLSVAEALIQLKLSPKPKAVYVFNCIRNARTAAINNFGMDQDRLIVGALWVFLCVCVCVVCCVLCVVCCVLCVVCCVLCVVCCVCVCVLCVVCCVLCVYFLFAC